MSYVRLKDKPAGVQVFFDDVPNRDAGVFNERWIATLDRTVPHTIKFVVTLAPGEDNDIVNVSVDGVQKACGTTWENYYRYDPEQAASGNVVVLIHRLIIQARGTSTNFGEVAAADRGFLIDNVTTTTTPQGHAVACPLPVAPQAGTQGATGPRGATGRYRRQGAAGVAGAAGTTTVIHETATPTLVGNTIHTLNAPLRRGERFVSLRAYLLTPSGAPPPARTWTPHQCRPARQAGQATTTSSSRRGIACRAASRTRCGRPAT